MELNEHERQEARKPEKKVVAIIAMTRTNIVINNMRAVWF